jgi:hypothetical protein
VQQAVGLLAEGCGAGARAERDARIIPSTPQLTVGLLVDLMADGSVPRSFGVPAGDQVRDAVCGSRSRVQSGASQRVRAGFAGSGEARRRAG